MRECEHLEAFYCGMCDDVMIELLNSESKGLGSTPAGFLLRRNFVTYF